MRFPPLLVSALAFVHSASAALPNPCTALVTSPLKVEKTVAKLALKRL